MATHRLVYEKSTHEYFLNGKKLSIKRSQKYHNHSSEFNHGYSGSGPAQLALAIVLDITGKSDGYQNFKFNVIAGLPQDKDFDITFEL